MIVVLASTTIMPDGIASVSEAMLEVVSSDNELLDVLEDESEWLEVESECVEVESEWLEDVLLLLVVDEVAVGLVDSPCLVSEVSSDDADIKVDIVIVLAFTLVEEEVSVVVVEVSLVYTRSTPLAIIPSHPCNPRPWSIHLPYHARH